VYVSDGEDEYEIPESKKTLSKTVLAERKPEEVAEFVEVKINITSPVAAAGSAFPVQGSKAEQKFTFGQRPPQPQRTHLMQQMESTMSQDFKVPAPVPSFGHVSSLSSQGSLFPSFSGGLSCTQPTFAGSEKKLSMCQPQPLQKDDIAQKPVNVNPPPLTATMPKDEGKGTIQMYRKHQVILFL